MSEKICDVCGEDPGQGSTCQSCGGRQYRYATDDLYKSEMAVDEDADLEAFTPRFAGTPVADLSIEQQITTSESEDDSSAAWSQRQQRATIDQIEHPEATGQLPENKKGRGCAFLFIAVGLIAGIGIFLALIMGVMSIEDKTPGEPDDSFDLSAVFDSQTPHTGPYIEEVALDSWDDVRIGDCFNWSRDDDSWAGKEGVPGIYPPTVVDCRKPHAGEFFFIGNLDFAEYPGIETADATAAALCLDEFGPYVKKEYTDSIWYSDGLYPSKEQWDSGDHSFHCLLYLPGEDVTERAVGSRK